MSIRGVELFNQSVRPAIKQSSLYLYIARGDFEYSYTPIVKRPPHPQIVRDVAGKQITKITLGITTAGAFYKFLDRPAVQYNLFCPTTSTTPSTLQDL